MYLPWNWRALACAIILLVAMAGPATAQDFASSTSDSPVGYIDNAVIRSRFRFRFDYYTDANHPDRAEYMFPLPADVMGRATLGTAPLDWVEYRAYTEVAFSPCCSVFADFGARDVQNALAFDPIAQRVDTNQAGGADTFAGVRYGLIANEWQNLTAQLKVGIPTGDPRRCLGTGHSSIEAGLLFNQRADDGLTLFGEVKDWVSINAYGVNFPDQNSSNVLSYGLGFGYDIMPGCECGKTPRVTAVFEMIGWTVLDGISSTGIPAESGVIVDVTGDTIVNSKYGLRYTQGKNTLYAGYGNSLTGDWWYKSVLRVEYTRNF